MGIDPATEGKTDGRLSAASVFPRLGQTFPELPRQNEPDYEDIPF